MIDPSLKKLTRIKHLLPSTFRPLAKGLLAKCGFQRFKYSEELNYWRERFKDGKWLLHDYYEKRLLNLAGEQDQNFLKGKIVADLGCGPRGSLNWAHMARLRVGIDVLSDSYSEFDIHQQDMLYVECSEKKIPLPSDYVDIMFTMNALDHCSNLPAMCAEIVRIVRKGGLLIAQFNLNEPGTFSEPQTLTEKLLDKLLLHKFDSEIREVSNGRLNFRGRKKP